jgi:ATP-binding cassette, subfamily C, type I secretion system permease/ATPase
LCKRDPSYIREKIRNRRNLVEKWSVSKINGLRVGKFWRANLVLVALLAGRVMSIAGHPHPSESSIGGLTSLFPVLNGEDPLTKGLRASARRMAFIAIFSGVINLLMLSGSLYMLQVYDRVIPSRNLATLFGLSTLVLVAYATQGYFEALRLRMLSRTASLFDASLQEPIHHALATLPLMRVNPVLMQQPLRDLDQIRAFMAGMGPTAFLDMPWIPIFLLALFLFHPMIGVTAMIGIAAIVAMTLVTERLSRGAARTALDCGAQRQVLADATRAHAEVIRALGLAGRFTARWVEANELFLKETIKSGDIYANLGSAAKTLRYILQSGMLGVGAYLVVADKASGGIMIASSIMMGRALAPIEIALSSWKQLVAARQSLSRLREILKITEPAATPPVVLPRPYRELQVQDLSVTPPGADREAVSHVSFALPAGTAMALLGASASGKTTLAKALVGIWQPRQGVVRLDGAAIDQWRRDDFGRYVGYLPQDVSLFDGTIAENISRFDDHPTSEAILKAADIAGVGDMVRQLPEGFATRIGEGGAVLSAGQRQRIGLARAVYGDPFLVVLDEPNANLDAQGEAALSHAIERLRQNNSIVIVISHRPSALAVLKVALVLHQGRMIAFGRSEDIFARARHATRADAAVAQGGSAHSAARGDQAFVVVQGQQP